MASGQLPQRNLKSVIATNLNFLMKTYHKTRKEVCVDLDISYTTFCDWVNARTYPRLDTLESLAFYFRIEVRDFFAEINQDKSLVERVTKYAKCLGVLMNKENEKKDYSDEEIPQ